MDNANNAFNVIYASLQNILQYRLTENINEWEKAQTYGKIIQDLCTTLDTLNYYKQDILQNERI